MKLKIAELDDINKVLELHFRYQIYSIKEFSYNNNNNYYELAYDTSKQI